MCSSCGVLPDRLEAQSTAIKHAKNQPQAATTCQVRLKAQGPTWTLVTLPTPRFTPMHTSELVGCRTLTQILHLHQRLVCPKCSNNSSNPWGVSHQAHTPENMGEEHKIPERQRFCSWHADQLWVLEDVRSPNFLTLLQTHRLTRLSCQVEPVLPSPFPHPGDDPHSGPRQWWHPHNHGSSVWGSSVPRSSSSRCVPCLVQKITSSWD